MFPYRQFSLWSILSLLTSFAVAAAVLINFGPPNISKIEQAMVTGCLGIVFFFPFDTALGWNRADRDSHSSTDIRDIILIWGIGCILLVIWAAVRFNWVR